MWLNSYTPPAAAPPVIEESELHEHTPAEKYDLNSVLPVPQVTLETEKLKLEPLVPLLHADALSQAFSNKSSDPNEVWFYPFPWGKAFESKTETLIYLEKQRRRANLLSFAAINKLDGAMCGILSLGCDPTQSTMDVKLIGVKIFPAYRGSHVLKHAVYLLLSYVLDSVKEGGLGLVRVGWRTPPENQRSEAAATKLGFHREGTMRCYEVSPAMPGSPFPNLNTIMDGTERVTENGVVYSMTVHDWLGGKREQLRAML